MQHLKLLLIDNYDSFTYNLMHLFAQIKGVEVVVVRNNELDLTGLENQKYNGVIIGPGPGSPDDPNYFGQNMDVIKKFGSKRLPILGICLGFQGIALAYGATLKQAKMPRHGKTSKLKIIESDNIFDSIPSGIDVMRYHSLMIDAQKIIPETLIITAEVNPESKTVKTNGREIMAIKHANFPIYGVQFHPESFATELGHKMAENFVNLVKFQT